MIGLDDSASTSDLVMRTRLGGGPGVATSDELLQHGLTGLRFFERFLPRYEAWTGRTLGGGVDGIKTTYNEVGGIRFDRLRADAARLRGVHGDLTDHHDQLAGNVGSLRSLWDGDAASEADDYGNRFLRDSADVADGVDVAHTLISMSADRAETAVLTRAKLVAGLDNHHVGGLTPRQIDQVIAAARGNANPFQLFEMVLLSAFTPLADMPAFTEQQSFTGMVDQASAWMGQRGEQWLDGVFVPSVEASYQAFQQYTSITTQDVGDSWTGMNDGVGALDPQAPGGTSPQGTPVTMPGPVSDVPPVTTAPTDSPAGIPDPGGVSAPGGTTPGAATSAPGGEPPVQVTTPSSTLPSAPPTSASPVGSTWQPSGSPNAPGDAQLAKAPDDAGADQVGRIGDGLTLSKPDADGHAQLTIRHPDGTMGSYGVDLNGMGTGGDGSNMSADGSTVIHDGAMTITLHRPSPDAPVTVTVDAGGGAPPESYTVNFGGDASPAGAGDPTLASSQPGTPVTGGPSMALGGGSPSTSADGSAGSGIGGLGADSGHQADAPKQPASYRGVGEMPAAAATGAAGAIAGRVAGGATGAGGMGMMPMMGGMGANRGGDQERKGGGRWNTTEDFFGEDTSSYAKIADMLDPELPSE